MTFLQRFVLFFFRKEKRQRVIDESKKWVIRCECGHEYNIWELGGVRYKAYPNQKPILTRCPRCLKSKIRLVRYIG